MQMAPNAHEEYDAMAADILLDPANEKCLLLTDTETLQCTGLLVQELHERKENTEYFPNVTEFV